MSIEKSANPNDMASQAEEQYNEQARVRRDAVEAARLAEHKRLLAAGDIDGESCMDCGEMLLAQRIADKRLRCTFCQDGLERKLKLGRGN